MHRALNIKLTLLLAILSASLCLAQQQNPNYDTIAEKVKTSFNQNRPEKIYELTSELFRKKMTSQQFSTGMDKFHARTGDWKATAFKEINEKGTDYVATFENGAQIFSLALNAQQQIDRLNFAPAPIVISTKSEKVAANNPLKTGTDRWVETNIRPYIQKGNTVGIIVAIIENGKATTYSYGSTSKTKNQLPDPNTTIFEIGSVTKTFNSLMLATMVTRNKMKLSDPINGYLPKDIPPLTFQHAPITLANLANHTSGFPRLPANIFSKNVDPKDPYKHYLADSLYSYLRTYKQNTKPGTTFSYSNFGAGVLGTILERTTNQSFEQLLKSTITGPLKMTNTTVTLSPAQQKNFAQGHNETGQPTAPWDLASLKGSGAIRSTLNDMLSYTKAQLNPTGPLKAAIILTHQTTFRGTGQDMGLGWRINHHNGSTFFHHAGGTGGFRSFVGFDVKRQIGIVILSNAADDVNAIGENFLKK